MANWEDAIKRDTRANQPAAGIAGRLYYVTDEEVMERDSGAAWENVEGTAYATDVIYTPIDVNDWGYLADPGNVDDALDQLAERVTDIEAGGGGGGGGLYASYARLQEQQASGTNGGAFSSGSYATRVLNTEVIDADGIVSLSSNQFTLQAGTYRILASAPAYRVANHKAKLYNVTDAADEIIGTSEFCDTGAPGAGGRAFVMGEFTIAAQKTFEIRHRCTTGQVTNGLGVASSYGDVEVYTVVEIWKYA